MSERERWKRFLIAFGSYSLGAGLSITIVAWPEAPFWAALIIMLAGFVAFMGLAGLWSNPAAPWNRWRRAGIADTETPRADG